MPTTGTRPRPSARDLHPSRQAGRCPRHLDVHIRVLEGRRAAYSGAVAVLRAPSGDGAPRVYGILEAYGLRSEKPTAHGGVRFWVIPNRFQIDSTYGVQQSDPVRRFFSVGLRFIF